MKIPNAIHKFVLHKKKKKYGKYVCTFTTLYIYQNHKNNKE